MSTPTAVISRTNRVLVVLLLIVTVLAWASMTALTVKTYREAPPLPEAVTDPAGAVLFTRADLVAGKAAFQRSGLMDWGSLFGMGAYFGEDYAARALRVLGEEVAAVFAERGAAGEADARARMRAALRAVRMSEGTVVVDEAVAEGFRRARARLVAHYGRTRTADGYVAPAISASELGQLADFFLYGALIAVGPRPDGSMSWTGDWPPEPLVGNTPPAAAMTWTVAGLGAMLLGIGLVLLVYRLWIEPGGHEGETDSAVLAAFTPPTPSQQALGKFFVFVALVLLIQIGAGALLGHYYVERDSFYGLPILDWLPFPFLRAVHVQTPIVWIGLGWIASALYLAPRIGGGEPRGQRLFVNLLFAAVLVIVVGAFAGSYAGIKGWIDRGWFWIGHQGLEYLELGRLWQILFFVGLAFWAALMARALWPAMRRLMRAGDLFSLFRAEHLLVYSAIGIAFIYMFGMIPLTGIDPSFTIQDFWRWWVVHLWVEWSFELFAAAVMGYFLMAIGLVRRELAERVVLFEWILILASGILGTGHHMFWAGEPPVWLAVGSVFSFLEVLPLYLLVLEAIDQRRQIARRGGFAYDLAFLFILGSAFWNFVGAGVFGGIINAPLINYYEHATFLTMNHAHTALFGAFGMLALGLIYLALRHMAGERIAWSDRPGRRAFWLYNLGLVLWVVLTFLPVGMPQLEVAFTDGLDAARSVGFYDGGRLWQWLRMVGDIPFALGALIMAWDIFTKARAAIAAARAARGAGAAA